MIRSRLTPVVIALTLIAVLASSLWPTVAGATGQAGNASSLAQMQQGTSIIARSGHDMGPLANYAPVQLAAVLSLRNESDLQSLITQQNTPGSPQYHKFITPQQFLDQYGPTPQDYQTVVGYLESNGFHVKTTSNRQLVIADGTAGQAEQAFNTRMDAFQYKGMAAFANVTSPRVPAALAETVIGVQGLDSSEMESQLQGLRPSASSSNSVSATGYTPQDIAGAYDYPSLHGFSGTGKTIAVATSGDFNDSDLQTFDSQFGLNPAGCSRVYVQGDGQTSNVETTLDVEWATAMAGGSNTLVYIVSNPHLANFTEMYNQIVTDDKADVVSSSWGASELDNPPMALDDGILEQGAAEGQSWFVASGDYGAYAFGSSSPSVVYPASSPYVTAIGGTSLTLSGTGNVMSETAWNGSGSGPSAVELQPFWEFGSPYFNNGYRWLADMAMDADPSPGMDLYWKGWWYTVGGTSIATPFAAALATEITQYDNGRLGIFAARLDQLANSNLHNYGTVLHDITQGNNGYYNAGPGWDPPTGWGSPDGYQLMLNY